SYGVLIHQEDVASPWTWDGAIATCEGTGCNITISKICENCSTPSPGITVNSTILDIKAGEYNYVHLDPPGSGPSLGSTYPYYRDVIGDYNTLTVNVTGRNYTGGLNPLQYVNVSFIRDDGIAAASNVTNSTGIATISVPDGVYNISIDGTGMGYDVTLVENVKVGKFVFSEGTTDTSGQYLAIVDGQPLHAPLSPQQAPGYGYYARIKTAGYGDYDTLEGGDGIFRGTYYDSYAYQGFMINQSFRKSFYGLAQISGYVKDEYCVAPACEAVEGATVQIKMHGSGETRYYNITPSDGFYSINVSPYSPDSSWNSPVYKPYDIGVYKGGCYNNYESASEGYTSGITFSERESKSKDINLTGSGHISGRLYRITTETGVSGANIEMQYNSNAYYRSDPTNETGHFSMIISPCYAPYSIHTQPAGSEAYAAGSYTGSQENLEIPIYDTGQGGFRVTVVNETGQPIPFANVSLIGPPPEHYLVTGEDGTAYITTLASYTGNNNYYDYNLTVDASHLGYGINSTIVNINKGNVTEFYTTLPATEVNISLDSDSGDDIDGMNVTMNSSNFVGYTVNGSVLFSVVPTGLHNITLWGEKTLSYYNGSQRADELVFTINVTRGDAGSVKQVGYVLNETRAVINVTNSTGTPLGSIDVTLSNSTTGTYKVTTDSDGLALFREIIPASNYTVTFNYTALQSMGFITPQSFTINVTSGNDENSGNKIKSALQDVQVRFNITNTTGDALSGVYISLLDGDDTAFNALGQSLNGTTNDSGILLIHNVVPTMLNYTIFANDTGYGVWMKEIDVGMNNSLNVVNRTLSPLTVNIRVFNNTICNTTLGTYCNIEENVNVSILFDGHIDQNATGDYLTTNITSASNYTQFTHLYIHDGNYTVNVTSPRYFNESDTFRFETVNPVKTAYDFTYHLKERSLTVCVRYAGAVLDEGVDINLTETVTGAGVIGTNGSLITAHHDVTNCTTFEYIPDGEYMIAINSTYYFLPDNWSFNYSAGMGEYVKNIAMPEERKIDIYLKGPGGAACPMVEGVNVSVLDNDTGAVITSLNGTILAVKNVTCYVSFTNLPDGTYNVTLYSNYSFVPDPWQFNTSDILKGVNSHTFTMIADRKITINLTNSTGDDLEEGANISIQDASGNVVWSTNSSFFLNATDVNDSVIFTHIPDTAFSINVSSNMYFNASQLFSTTNITEDGITQFNFTLTRRSIYVYVENSTHDDLEYGVTVNLTNTDGSTVFDTQGSPITGFTGVKSAAVFNYVPDGNFFLNITSGNYFSQSDSVSTADMIGGNNNFTFILYSRNLDVSLYDFADRALLSGENMTVGVYNSTGLAYNTTSDPLNGTTVTGLMGFTGLLDGMYNVTANSTNSSLYVETNETFDPQGGQSSSVSIYMKKTQYGYFNVTVYKQGMTTPISGATVQLRNASASGNVIDTGTTDGSGNVILEVNTSLYDQSEKNMTFTVSASGYDTNSSTGYYNVTTLGVESVTVTLAATPAPPPVNTGGGGRTTGGGTTGGALVSETIQLGTVSADVPKKGTFKYASVHSIEDITVLAGQDASGVSVTARASSRPAGAPLPVSSSEGKIYRYVDLSALNLPDSAISTVTITFAVSASWLKDNGISYEDVHLFRYSNGAWTKLPTTYISNDGTWYLYRAVSPGFTTYAIAGYYKKEYDFQATIYKTSMNANDCKTAYVTLKNTGSGTLTNLHIEDAELPWGSVMQTLPLSVLPSGTQDRITLRICAGRDAGRGEQSYELSVSSDQLTKTVSASVEILKTYPEIIEEQLKALEAELDDLKSVPMNATEAGYYRHAAEKLEESRNELSRHNYDSALSSLSTAKNYLDKISREKKPGYLDSMLIWLMANYLFVIAGLIIAGMSTFVLFRRRIARELPELPTGGELVGGVMRIGEETIGNLMSMAKDLEGRVDSVDFDSLGDEQRKWYNRVKLQIEGIKRSIDNGDFKKAQRHVNDAELYMKMLELHSASE
ncbi:MAG: PGF-pre-PGF domain-containing protein, partial [Candidatus Aenigmarchaeota archaeon]|nr:PGF-pre-PGF domain-containing protein [Candidatus Aenigmarchaeota archaeon]